MPYKNPDKQKYAQHQSYLRHREKSQQKRKHKRIDDIVTVSLLKEASPCRDCHQFFPYYVMHFDHLRDKVFNISTWARDIGNVDLLMEEVAKCDLVCANCHAIRSYFRLVKQNLPHSSS